MKVRYILLMLLSSLMTLSSCNRNNEPPTEVYITILEEYMPQEISFDRTDEETVARWRDLNRKLFVVKSADEFPDDPVGFSKAYTSTNFKDHMLLITYLYHLGPYETCRNNYIRNNIDKTYYWYLSLGMVDDEDIWDNSPVVRLSRYAIKVPKIPSGFTPEVQFVISDFGWDWGEE